MKLYKNEGDVLFQIEGNKAVSTLKSSLARYKRKTDKFSKFSFFEKKYIYFDLKKCITSARS